MPGLGRDFAAVVFDLDGVLLESEQLWSLAKRRLSLERGGRWTAAAEQDMLGMSSPEWSRYMREELGLEMEPGEISTAVAELLETMYRERLPLLAGADAAVRSLAERYPLGLASSSNRATIDLVLELAGWMDRFTTTVSSEEVAAGKPAPDVYVEASRRLALAPGECVAIEDSEVGIRAARAAGLAVVAIPNRSYRPRADVLSSADLVLASITELPGALGAAPG